MIFEKQIKEIISKETSELVAKVRGMSNEIKILQECNGSLKSAVQNHRSEIDKLERFVNNLQETLIKECLEIRSDISNFVSENNTYRALNEQKFIDSCSREDLTNIKINEIFNRLDYLERNLFSYKKEFLENKEVVERRFIEVYASITDEISELDGNLIVATTNITSEIDSYFKDNKEQLLSLNSKIDGRIGEIDSLFNQLREVRLNQENNRESIEKSIKSVSSMLENKISLCNNTAINDKLLNALSEIESIKRNNIKSKDELEDIMTGIIGTFERRIESLGYKKVIVTDLLKKIAKLEGKNVLT